MSVYEEEPIPEDGKRCKMGLSEAGGRWICGVLRNGTGSLYIYASRCSMAKVLSWTHPTLNRAVGLRQDE